MVMKPKCDFDYQVLYIVILGGTDMKNMTVFYSDTCGDARNCIYPHRVDLSDPGQREKVFRHDHVLAHFSDGHRGNENFLSADTVGIDVDNEKSDEEADWVTPEDIADMLPNVQYILVPSRHHMMEKGKEGQQKGARPRFHLIFPIDRIFGRTEYESLKRQLAAVFPFADDNALDASRMFFGTPDGLCIVHEGERLITDYLEQAERETDETYSVVDLQTGIPGERVYETKKVIPLGRRNTTLHRFALQVLTRFGRSEEARKLYREEALCCEQPLSEGELGTIWRSAEKYYDKVISRASGYLSPEKYTEALVPVQAEPVWRKPVSFDTFNLPDFPVEALPAGIREYVLEISEDKQAPVDMAAVLALVMLSVCNQKKYRIEIKPGWQEPVNIFALIVASPSERKSQVIGAMQGALNEYVRHYNFEHRADYDFAKLERDKLKANADALAKEWKKGNVTKEQMKEALKELEDYIMPTQMRLFAQDATSEAICGIMAENGGRVAIVASEGDEFGSLGTRYSNDPNFAPWLMGYSEENMIIDRANGKQLSIDRASMTVGMMAQPVTLAEVMGNRKFAGRGITSRFLYSLPKSLVGKRRYETKPVSEESKSKYRQIMWSLLDVALRKEPIIITLSKEAGELMHSFYDEIEHKQADELIELGGWAGKLVGNVGRIAANLCLAEQIPGMKQIPDTLVASAKNVEDAITIGRYFIEHAQRAFSPVCDNSVLKTAKKILEIIQREQKAEFTLRALTRHFSSAGQRKEVLTPALNLLTDLDYLEIKEESYRGFGRPRAVTYLVNPCLLNPAD